MVKSVILVSYPGKLVYDQNMLNLELKPKKQILVLKLAIKYFSFKAGFLKIQQG
jgi:hypothetical protein